MIQMPLLPIINGLVLKLTIDNLLVMRICGALLSASIMFMIYKILRVLMFQKIILQYH